MRAIPQRITCVMAIYRQPAKWKSIPSERMSQTVATISVAAAANAMLSFFFIFMASEPVACAMAMLRQLCRFVVKPALLVLRHSL